MLCCTTVMLRGCNFSGVDHIMSYMVLFIYLLFCTSFSLDGQHHWLIAVMDHTTVVRIILHAEKETVGLFLSYRDKLCVWQ